MRSFSRVLLLRAPSAIILTTVLHILILRAPGAIIQCPLEQLHPFYHSYFCTQLYQAYFYLHPSPTGKLLCTHIPLYQAYFNNMGVEFTNESGADICGGEPDFLAEPLATLGAHTGWHVACST